jgi:exopolysaccharide biosynthesis predicted pyruvyltransferase EpsI
MSLSTVQSVKDKLHNAMDNLGDIRECILLGYPNHKNTGDRLIWLGNLLLLNDYLQVKIKYVASSDSYSDDEMARHPDLPIILHGGGNLGDVWRDHQIFKERIISKYKNRKIIIFPQTIHFKKESNLENASRIFNEHPDLTIFLRDDYSYEIAQKAFYNCRIIKSPDTAFQLFNTFDIPSQIQSRNSILALVRNDFEKISVFSQTDMSKPKYVLEDWSAFHHNWLLADGVRARLKSEKGLKLGELEFRLVQLLTYTYREIWQRGLVTPQEFLCRSSWFKNHPYKKIFRQMNHPRMHYLCLSFMHSGIYQILQHQFVITNRLHGHILCTLLGKPHIFLPNSYYKNEGFYQAWTSDIPFCKFIKDFAKVEEAIQELSCLNSSLRQTLVTL